MTVQLSTPYRMPSYPDAAELVTEDGRVLPLVSANLRIEAGGGLARVVLEQTFENTSTDTLHVTYKMPLPADGAVSGYAFTIGERTITGRVDPKETARERFEQALAQGKTAAILEQEKADIFTQELGNIPAKKTIVAKITIDQRLAWLPEGEWELRFPTVIGPRYCGTTETADDARAVAVETSPEALAARVDMSIRIGDEITKGRRAESPSHELDAKGDGSYALVSRARLDRDVVVRWPVAKQDVGVSISVARAAAGNPTSKHVFGLLTIVPPAPDARSNVPRDLIVLLDTSGSMGGTPLEQAKKVVRELISSLGSEDRFELVEFSMRPNAFHAGPLPATEKDKRAAIAWLDKRVAGGGTEMHTAVMESLKALRKGAQRQVVLVTDGYIGGEEKIVALLADKLPESCRMHVVGVGAAPNRALSAAIARAGRGAAVLAAIGEDLERATKRLLAKTAQPVLTDVVISGSAIVAQAPENAPDVFAGSPVLAGLQLRPEGGEIEVRGKLARGEWVQRVRVPAVGEGEGNQALVALYGRERVADLDIRWAIGRNVEGVDRAVERIGVDFQIATRLTSWVAIDEERTVDPYAPVRRESVPQELPYGTSLASFMAPAGMTLAGSAGRAMAMPLAAMSVPAPGGAPPPPPAQAAYGAPMPMARPMRARKSEAREEGRLARSAEKPEPMINDLMMPAQAPLAKRKRGFSFVAFLIGLILFLLAIAAVVWFLSR
jgi:Ca-activated chloride channel family protein